jgi:ribonuclease HI
MAYTDGSQKKVPLLGQEEHEITVIGSGIYLPANPHTEEQHIGVRATQNGHNTAYRAELIAILGALRLGHPNIMTDSVNSIHAIKAMIHRPATLRYHRHRAVPGRNQSSHTGHRPISPHHQNQGPRRHTRQ